MPIHIVSQGEHLSRIAQNWGFSDYRIIWDDPQNSELRQKRTNPNVLMPGDSLFIPESSTKEVSRPPEQLHVFRLLGQPLVLRLRLVGIDHLPLTGTPCELRVDGKVHSLATDGEGRIECPISKTAEDAWLVFKDPQVPFDQSIPIKIGHLDPVTEASGQKARLANLGYLFGDSEGIPEASNEKDQRFALALEEFQCEHDLTVDGICGPNTQSKAQDIHGC